ncbi:MAG: hypothetical protein KDD38_04315 [Bdellovibrionales bacterium]|nr:hypothetical protein [Bdellovibrionales bacterium]
MKILLICLLFSLLACTSKTEVTSDELQITCHENKLHSNIGQIYSGKLRMYVLENPGENSVESYAFELQNGEEIDVTYEDHIKRIPLNAEINILGKLNPISESLQILKTNEKNSYSSGTCSEGVYKAENPVADKQERDQDIGLYYMVFKNDTLQFKQENIDKDAKEIERLYNQFSHGKRKFKVRAYRVEMPYADYKSCGGCQNLAVQHAVEYQKANNIQNTKYVVNMTFAIYWNGVSYSGFAGLGSNHALTSQGRVKTIVHELGHTLGLGHANSKGIEYADQSSVMGNPSPVVGLNSVGLMYLDIHNPETTQYVSKTQKLYLAPVDYALPDIMPKQTQIAVVNSGGTNYYISIKSKENYVSRPSDLYVHIESGTSTDIIEVVSPGSKFKLPRGDASIDYLTYTDGMATVDIYVNSKDAPPQDTVIAPPLSPPTNKAACKYSNWSGGSNTPTAELLNYNDVVMRDLSGETQVLECEASESGSKTIVKFVRQKIQCTNDPSNGGVKLTALSKEIIENEIANTCESSTPPILPPEAEPAPPADTPFCNYNNWPEGHYAAIPGILPLEHTTNRDLPGETLTQPCPTGSSGEKTITRYKRQVIKCINNPTNDELKLIAISAEFIDKELTNTCKKP